MMGVDDIAVECSNRTFDATSVLSLRIWTSSGQATQVRRLDYSWPDRRLSASFHNPVINREAPTAFKKSPGR